MCGGQSPRLFANHRAFSSNFLIHSCPSSLADSVITSVTESVIVPSTIVVGTGFIFAENQLPPQFFDQPSIAPTFSGTGKSDVFASYNSGLTSPVVNGDEVSTGDLDLHFVLGGCINGSIETPGSNWASYVGGEGQVAIPYTVQLDVTCLPASRSSALPRFPRATPPENGKQSTFATWIKIIPTEPPSVTPPLVNPLA